MLYDVDLALLRLSRLLERLEAEEFTGRIDGVIKDMIIENKERLCCSFSILIRGGKIVACELVIALSGGKEEKRLVGKEALDLLLKCKCESGYVEVKELSAPEIDIDLAFNSQAIVQAGIVEEAVAPQVVSRKPVPRIPPRPVDVGRALLRRIKYLAFIQDVWEFRPVKGGLQEALGKEGELRLVRAFNEAEKLVLALGGNIITVLERRSNKYFPASNKEVHAKTFCVAEVTERELLKLATLCSNIVSNDPPQLLIMKVMLNTVGHGATYSTRRELIKEVLNLYGSEFLIKIGDTPLASDGKKVYVRGGVDFFYTIKFPLEAVVHKTTVK